MDEELKKLSTKEKVIIVGGLFAIAYLLYSAYISKSATTTTPTVSTVDTTAANDATDIQTALNGQSASFNDALNAATGQEQSDVAALTQALSAQNDAMASQVAGLTSAIDGLSHSVPTGNNAPAPAPPLTSAPATQALTADNWQAPNWDSLTPVEQAGWIVTNGQTIANTPGLALSVNNYMNANAPLESAVQSIDTNFVNLDTASKATK